MDFGINNGDMHLDSEQRKRNDAQPLVSVICTCYNHEKYIRAALESVAGQTYAPVELVVIDNASTDASLHRIEAFCDEHPGVRIVRNADNKGLCRAFNQGLGMTTGKYVIDLSGDDLLLPERIARQVAFFESMPEDYGVVFSNAQYLNPEGVPLHFHYPVDLNGRTTAMVPSGDVYREILEKYFICTPTMMMRRTVLVTLGGYDEALTYEDFDFWVRSAVICRYGYQDEVLTQKRLLPDSLSNLSYRSGSGMLESTYAVCDKAYHLNRTQAEFDALAGRIKTYIRKSFYTEEFALAIRFRKLLCAIETPSLSVELIVLLCRMRLPVNKLYRIYFNWKINRVVGGGVKIASISGLVGFSWDFHD